MKHKNAKLGLLLTSLLLAQISFAKVTSSVISYVAKTGPGTAGAGKQWPNNRFVADASENCITDNLTGLMWAKDANLLGTANWDDAFNKIAAMNSDNSASGYHLCGYSDWRLPNINELESLINYSIFQSGLTALDWLNNPTQGFSNVQQNAYWSSNAFNANDAMAVYFSTGGVDYHINKAAPFYVWPVRGGK